MKFFEEIAVRDRRHLGSHHFTAEEIKRFAAAYDPHPFHLDEAAGRDSHFGGLCASGWHTLAVWMQLNVREVERQVRNLEIAGVPVASVGPSPGFDQLKWQKPVFAVISYESEIIGKKPSRSRPEWGLISMRNVGRNQAGEDVVSFIAHVFVERRDKSPPQQADSIPG